MVVAPIYRRIAIIAAVYTRIAIAPIDRDAVVTVITVVTLMAAVMVAAVMAVATMASMVRAVSGHRRPRAHGQDCRNCQGDC